MKQTRDSVLLPGITPTTLSKSGSAIIAFDGTTVLCSADGAAYVPIAGAGAVPGGANTNVQFNNAGAFGGNAAFLYDGTDVTMLNALTLNTVRLQGAVAPLIDSADGALAAVSAVGSGRLRFNLATLTWESSVNGGAYGSILGAGSGSTIAASDTEAFVLRDGALSTDRWFRVDTFNSDVFIGREAGSSTVQFFVSNNASAFRIRSNTGLGDWLSVALTGPGAFSFGNGTTLNPAMRFQITDNINESFFVEQGNDDYINVDTRNGSELTTLGNTTTNPGFTLAGSGAVTLGNAAATIGFYGQTPAPLSAVYTAEPVAILDRNLVQSTSATIVNNNNVLAALLTDLKAIGIIA